MDAAPYALDFTETAPAAFHAAPGSAPLITPARRSQNPVGVGGGAELRAYYTDSSVTIYHGDALQVMERLTEGVNAVVTDPPYSSGTRREAAKGVRKSMNRTTEDVKWFGTDSLTTSGFIWMMRACALEWKRLLPDGAHVLSFIDWRMASALSGAIESADLRSANLVVWDKAMFGMGACFRNQHELVLHFTHGVGAEPNRRDTPNVLRYPAVRNGEHDTEKPLALLERLVDTVVPPGGIVLDCFMGSGTTLVAAKRMGRRAIGIDNEEHHCATAARRCSQEMSFGGGGGGEEAPRSNNGAQAQNDKDQAQPENQNQRSKS